MNSFLSLQTTCVFLLWHFFCLADSSDEECQTWLPPEPTHLWPWPYQPWHSQLKQIPSFISGLFGCYNEQWGRWGVVGCFFVCQLFPPSYELFRWLLSQSWMSFQRFASKRLHGGFTFPHFCLAGLSQLGLIMYVQRTLTCFSTLS